MRRAGDVQKQSVGAIQADQRRETVAPVGNPFQQGGIGAFVSRNHYQRLHHGAGIGQGLAFIKAEPGGAHFQGMNMQRIACLQAYDQRRFKRPAVLAYTPVGRQARKPQRQYPPFRNRHSGDSIS